MATDLRTVRKTERLNSSANGNPRYRVIFTDGTTLSTAVDTSLAYGITNREYEQEPHEVVTDSRGHLIDLKRVGR